MRYSILTTDLQWLSVSSAELALAMETLGISEFKKQVIAVVQDVKKTK